MELNKKRRTEGQIGFDDGNPDSTTSSHPVFAVITEKNNTKRKEASVETQLKRKMKEVRHTKQGKQRTQIIGNDKGQDVQRPTTNVAIDKVFFL